VSRRGRGVANAPFRGRAEAVGGLVGDTRETMPTSDGPRRSGDSTTTVGGGRFAPGTVLASRYRVVSFLGKGGMGEVYRADDLTLGQAVAIKFLPSSVAGDESRLAQFRSEVRIGREVAHPNVCRVYDIVEAPEGVFLAMEYVDGEDLATLLRRIGRLPEEKALEIARQVCAGLAAAHDRGVIHRDLKPANIMLDGRGRVRLTDFGIAALSDRVEGRAAAAGTPAYMAPEQLDGDEATARSDLYALGLVLHELFTGKRMFEGDTLDEIKRSRTRPPGEDLTTAVRDIDEAVERAVRWCVEPDPQRRPSSAVAVAAALPGGDPLAAALAAGETPSPELVAASGRIGGLHPAIALLLLVVFGAGLYVLSWLQVANSVVRWAPLDKPPAAMIDRAKETIERLGIETVFVDSVWGYSYSAEYPRWVAANIDSADRWERLRAARPATVYFWYRVSPTEWSVHPIGAHRDRVAPAAPAWSIPGEVYVSLDLDGRLRRIYVQPEVIEERDADAAPAPAYDFGSAFELAGLDPDRFEPTEPRLELGMRVDESRGWTGLFPELPDVPMYVQAGARDGGLAYFQYRAPWELREGLGEVREALEHKDEARVRSGLGSFGHAMSAFGRRLRGTYKVFVNMLMMGLLIVGGVLTYKNIKAGRADTRGAWRVALFSGVFMTFARWCSGANLLPRDQFELIQIFAWGAFMGLGAWSAYLAIEPVVRRRWPTMLVGWTRLISGHVTDPLVGRSVAAGAVAGVLVSLAYAAGFLAEQRDTEFAGLSYVFSAISIRYPFSGMFAAPVISLLMPFVWVLLLVGLRRLVRREWIAVVLFVPVLALISENLFLNGWSPVVTLLCAVLYTVLYVRLGVLAVMAAVYVQTALDFAGLPAIGEWYAHAWYVQIVPMLLFVLWGLGVSVFGRSNYELTARTPAPVLA